MINGQRVLLKFIEGGDLEQIKLLYDKGADLNKRGFNQRSALLDISQQDLDPSEIDLLCKFTKLQALRISSNAFEWMPESIMKMEHLALFQFGRNPILEPPVKDIKGGFKGLKSHYHRHPESFRTSAP